MSVGKKEGNPFAKSRYCPHGNGVTHNWAPYWMPKEDTQYVRVLRWVKTFVKGRYPTRKKLVTKFCQETIDSLRRAHFLIRVPMTYPMKLMLSSKGLEYVAWLRKGNRPPKKVKNNKLEVFTHIGYLNREFKYWFGEKENEDKGRCNSKG